MGFSFYFNSALKNIRYGKKQAFLFCFSVFISVALVISLQLWSSTAEDLAAKDFLQDQDFEMKITTYRPEEIPLMIEWLNADPLIDTIHEMYYNLACFNAEDKSEDYRFFPEDNQEDMNDPISLTSLGLFPKAALERIENQFLIRGSFDIGLNEVLISEYEAIELERIYGLPIQPGMQLNISIAKRSPELGEIYLHHMQLENFYNVTLKGIYRTIPKITLLQKIFSSNFLKDSVIFLQENMNEVNLLQMRANGIVPVICVKMNIDELKKDGIDQILSKLNDLADRMKINFQASQYIILETPTLELQQSYSFAKTAIIFIIPVIITSLILTILINNIIIEKRKEQILILKDRGGLNWQVLFIFLIELIMLNIISVILAILFSFIISASIPSIASGTFSAQIFREFIVNAKFPYSLTLYLLIGVFLITCSFSMIKLIILMKNNLEERQKLQREKIQRTITIIILSFLTGLILSLIIYYTIQIYKTANDIYNFNIVQTQQSMFTFLLIMLFIIVLSIFLTIVFEKLLGKIKRLYNLIIVRNAFFVLNSFKSSKNKLSSLLVILILITSINIFSLNLYQSLKQNEEMESYYNNGADLRIQTSFIDFSYVDNISQIQGINETMAILAVDGTLIYNSVTVYGINSVIYPRIGRWDGAYSNQQEINKMFQNLNASDDGAIISDYVANRMNLTINSQIVVTGLPNRSYFERFLVKGIIHSAPGLGLAYGMNIELNQQNQEFLLINDRVMINKFNVKETNLFFASLDEGYLEKDIVNELIQMREVISINPEVINDQFIGRYVSQYIPDVKVFLLIQIILVNLIGLIIIITNVDFIVRLRDQNNAILHSLGNSNNNLARMIFSELLVIEITSFITAITLSFPLAFFSLKVNRASFTIHNIIPYEYSIAYAGIFLLILIIIIFTLLAVVPSLIRFSKRDLVTLLR